MLGWPRPVFRHGKSPHGVDDVAGDVARDVGVSISHFRSPGTGKSNAMSCAAVQSVGDIVVVRRS